MDDTRCSICGGNAGNVTRTQGRHELCAARQRHGLPTPSLGERCPKCQGRGWWRATPVPAILPVYFSPADDARGIAAIFPPCSECGGKGYN